MRRVRIVVALLSLAALGLGIWAFALEPASLVQHRQRLAIPQWSAELAGLKVAVFADMHVGSPFNGLDKLGRIVETTNALQPDLVLIPGDLVIQEELGGRHLYVSPGLGTS